MTKIYFVSGKYVYKDGEGIVQYYNENLNLIKDDFILIGDIEINTINISDGSLKGQNNKIINEFLSIVAKNSKVENVNNANRIWLWDNSSISNSSTNNLESSRENNTIEGTVSAKTLTINGNATLNIAKDGVLKTPNKNTLDFLKISGDGRIYDEKVHAYYDTNNNLLEYEKNIDLSTLQSGDGNATFSFDGIKLVLNKGYEFNLSGDKPVFITNNATILKADINGTKLKSINGSGSIKELHLSNNAEFSLNGNLETAVIDKDSTLILFKQVDFKNISGSGLVNINGTIYDTDGHALNDVAYDINKSAISVENNIQKYGVIMAKAIENKKAQIDAYINTDEQNNDVDLLNIEAGNNDNLL